MKRAKLEIYQFLIFILVLCIGSSLFAQNNSGNVNKDVISMFGETGIFKIEAYFSAGAGFKQHKIGETTESKDINISGGGGIGFALTIGYVISSNMDLDLSAGIQNTSLSENVSNAEGTFHRNVLLSTLKYKINISNNKQAKIGAGIGFYMTGKWDVDGSEVPGGAHEIIEYDNTMGFHITGDYENMFISNWSWSVGLKFYSVSYKAKSAESNGVSVPVNLVNDEIRELNGGGFALMFSIVKYFKI